MPAAWTAADITFQVSADGSTYCNLYEEDGTEFTLTVGASYHVMISPDSLWGAHWIKVRSGTAGTPVNQAAARTITLVTRSV